MSSLSVDDMKKAMEESKKSYAAWYGRKRAKIDEIIDEINYGRNAGPDMMQTWFQRIIAKLEKFKEEEL